MPKTSKTKTPKKRTQTPKMPKPAHEITPEDAKKVKGGIGLLLPAVQKIK